MKPQQAPDADRRWNVPCPSCGAPAGFPCVTRSGAVAAAMHRARLAARLLNVPPQWSGMLFANHLRWWTRASDGWTARPGRTGSGTPNVAWAARWGAMAARRFNDRGGSRLHRDAEPGPGPGAF